MAEDVEIITLQDGGEAHRLLLIDDEGEALPLVVRGDPPARFVHRGRAWYATGALTEPPGEPLSYEYRAADEIS